MRRPAPSARLCVSRAPARIPPASSSSLSDTKSRQPVLEDAERQVEGHSRRDAFGKRVGRLAHHARSGSPGARDGVGALGADGDDARLQAKRVAHRDAGRTRRFRRRSARTPCRRPSAPRRSSSAYVPTPAMRSAARSPSGRIAGLPRPRSCFAPSRAPRRSRGRARSTSAPKARISRVLRRGCCRPARPCARDARARGTQTRSTGRGCPWSR